MNDRDWDDDGDGLTNGIERDERTDPLLPNTDGDGTADGDEVAQGGDPTSSSDNGVAPDPADVCDIFMCVSPVDQNTDKLCERYVLHVGPYDLWQWGNAEGRCRTRKVRRGQCLDITLEFYARFPGCPQHWNYCAFVSASCCSILSDPGNLLGCHQFFGEQNIPTPHNHAEGLHAQLYLPQIKIIDARHGGQGVDTAGNPTLDDTTFESAPAEWRVDGAVTDGVSLCAIRVDPPLPAALQPHVRIVKDGTPVSNKPIVYGGLRAHSGNVLPALPMSSDLGTATQSQAYSNEINIIEQTNCWFVPPEAYLSNAASDERLEDGQWTDLVLELTVLRDGQRTIACSKDLILIRPPLILVHGIMSDPGTWGTAEWSETLGSPVPTRLYKTDWSGTSTLGYRENVENGVPANMIRLAIDDYRLGRDQTPVAGVPGCYPWTAHTRGFQGRRYAATRADVVGHSQGGQITRMYIADSSGIGLPISRGVDWPAFDTTRTDNPAQPNRRYLRVDNFNCGDIRRIITIGSPFDGSPLATIAAPWLTPTEGHLTKIYSANALGFIPASLQAYLFDVNGEYIPPTCAYDLSEGSSAQSSMETPFAVYPNNDRAPAWFAVVGIGALPLGSAPVQGALWELLYRTIARLADGSVTMQQLSPASSDFIVTVYSQTNAVNDTDPNFAPENREEHCRHSHMAMNSNYAAETESSRVTRGALPVLLDPCPTDSVNPISVLLSKFRSSMGTGDLSR